jgi:hypothetical protein
MCNGVQSHLAPPFQQSIPPLVLRASSGSSLLGMKQYALRKSFKSPYISSTTTEECQRKSSFSDTHTNPDYCLCLILSGPPAAGSVSPCALAFSMSSTIFFPFNIPRRLSSTLDMMNSAAAGKFAPIVAGHTYPYHYTHASAYSIHSPHYTPPPDLLRYYYLGNPRSLSPLSKLRQKLSWTNLRQRTSQWRRYKSRTNAVPRSHIRPRCKGGYYHSCKCHICCSSWRSPRPHLDLTGSSATPDTLPTYTHSGKCPRRAYPA